MKKVLIIEDNEANLYLLRFILTKINYTVLEARTGREGVARAVKEAPDIILMDIQLPDIDGLEATRRIRDSGVAANVPIVALTSYAMASDRQMALDAGCTAYIPKPIDPETFITQIQKLV